MSTDILELAFDEPAELTLETVHREQADLVWRSLQRLGVRSSDLEDLFQETFVVVHRKLRSLQNREALRSWLYSICVRVARAHRRRAFFRREVSVGESPDEMTAETDPEKDAIHAQGRARLLAILDEMDIERRAVFVMYEIDEMPCEDIATIVGIPTGTVHSRLYAARAEFAKVLSRHQARDARRKVS